MNIPLIMRKRTAIANIFIAFRNTIRLLADILIASADTLIVVKKEKRKAESTWRHSPPKSYFFVVTSSRCHKRGIIV